MKHDIREDANRDSPGNGERVAKRLAERVHIGLTSK